MFQVGKKYRCFIGRFAIPDNVSAIHDELSMVCVHIRLANFEHLLVGIWKKNEFCRLAMNNGIPPGYEQFWSEAIFRQSKSASVYNQFADSEKKWRTPSPELTDGQISIALDTDIAQLVLNITQELSRTNTGSTTTSDSSMPASLLALSETSHVRESLPVRATSLPMSVAWNVPPRSSTGHNVWKSYTGSLQSTHEEPRQLPLISFPPVTALRGGKPVRISLEEPGSRSLSAASDVEPLPQVLHALDNESDDCIVVVRRITRLGFKSNRILKLRFEEIGWEVRNVVLLPSRSRPMDGSPSGGAPHARPSSMGFVVFSEPQNAKECLALGSVDVEGIQVLIQPFTRQYKPTLRESS